MKTKKTIQKRWPPGNALPKPATAAKEERFWLAHDFDEAMEAGGEPHVGSDLANGSPRA
jgi:hypothetical protein